MGIKYYLGDLKVYPDVDIIDSMIEVYSNSGISPVVYTLYVGVTGDGRVIIIEINDIWAIGIYGFRMREIINS